MTLWAAYLLLSAQKQFGLIGASVKICCRMLVGGPVAPAIIMLWQRDDAVLGTIDYWGIAKQG